MTEADSLTQSVVDAAKYLRHIRAIDPAELDEYVPNADQAIIRNILRRHAHALSLWERPDGCFEPIDEAPLSASFDGVKRFPPAYEQIIETALIETFGEQWYAGVSGDRLRDAIRSFKADYYEERTVTYDETTALGYALYHAPNYFASIQYVLDDLVRHGQVPRRLRILDVGAGVGGPALGMHAYLDDRATVVYDAIEPSEATSLLRTMLSETGPHWQWTVHESTVESFEPSESYDLIVLANVISELAHPSETLDRLGAALTPNGAILCVAPADKNTSLGLRSVERSLVDDRERFTIFSPTLRLWPDRHPTDPCWSFDERTPIETPRIQTRLDTEPRARETDREPGTGEFVHPEVRFSYSILRTDNRRRSGVQLSRDRHVPLAESREHITNRVDLVAVKLSHSLSEGEGHPVYRIGDGSQSVPHFAVHTRETALNRDLSAASYGDVLVINQGLILWNEDEEAINIVIDEPTAVDRIPPG